MIEVKNLCKTFGPKKAVDDVSFSVGKGDILGFLGPNGAGKSTTMRMITGYIPPTDGTATVGGFDITSNPLEAKRLIGYLPESAPCYTDMTVLGFLEFAADMRGLQGSEKKKAVDRVLDLCFLGSVAHQSIDTLSKGYRHRTCFAQSIIHDPQVLIMDEPTDGLDPNQKQEVRNIIKRMGEDKAIVFSTHILEEVEAVCNRAIIIDRGKVVANGSPTELKADSKNAGSVILTVHGALAIELSRRIEELDECASVDVESEADQRARVRAYPKSPTETDLLPRAIGRVAQRENWIVEQLETDVGRLDEVFRRITFSETGQ